jgi:HEAT repeat protein
MRRLIALLALLITVPACAQQSNPLRQAAAEGVKSMAWKIETEGVSVCCCNENDGYWTNHGDRARIEYDELIVVAQMEGTRIRKVRVKEPNCPIKVDRFVQPTQEQSLDYLLSKIDDADREGQLLSVVAMHDHPRVVPELIQLARHHRETEVRRHAIFWLGQKAGEKAAGELRRAVDEDPNEDVREHAVFAISQLPHDRSVPMLINLVKTHKSPGVRKKAMFWLAQTGDQRALDLIEDILKP